MREHVLPLVLHEGSQCIKQAGSKGKIVWGSILESQGWKDQLHNKVQEQLQEIGDDLEEQLMDPLPPPMII